MSFSAFDNHVSIESFFATAVLQNAHGTGQWSARKVPGMNANSQARIARAKEKGRWITPAALKHGSAVGCPAAGSCFHAVTGIAELISGRSPERNCPTS